MKIREAILKDIPQLTQLFDGYRVFYKKESDISGANSFLTERLTSKDSKIYVAENSNNDLTGFVQLYPLFSSTRMQKLWLLNDLFVDESYRGKGISVQLINKAKDLVINTSACALCLETEKTNSIGNNLYPKTGFELNKASNFYEWNAN